MFLVRSEIQGEGKAMRHCKLIVLCVTTCSVLVAVFLIGQLLFTPVGTPGTSIVIVYRGDTFDRVKIELKKQGLIRSDFWLEQLARWRKLPQRLKAGIYRISTPISLWHLIRWFERTRPELVRLTIWEGMMAKEIGQLVESLGLGDAERFMEIVLNPRGKIELPFEWRGSLEGLLFPATYYVPPLRPGDEAYLVQLMVDTFIERFWKPYRAEIEKSPFSLRELVIIASMVQWEVKMDEERPIVAGVIINRLKHGMKLEIDATVLYALGERKRRVLYRDLKVNSPYNTYRYKGLPPGAICSPGLPSLLAALRPAKVPYLYYVAREDGYHTFSETYKEHLEAVQTYRQWKAKQWSRGK